MRDRHGESRELDSTGKRVACPGGISHLEPAPGWSAFSIRKTPHQKVTKSEWGEEKRIREVRKVGGRGETQLEEDELESGYPRESIGH